MVNQAHEKARELVKAAQARAELLREKAQALEATGGAMTFDARSRARRKLVAMKMESSKMQEEADAVTKEAKALAVSLKDPSAMSTHWLDELGDGSGPQQRAVVGSFESNNNPHGVKLWLLGVPFQTPGVGHVYYGAYCRDNAAEDPPLTGWRAMRGENHGKPPAPVLKKKRMYNQDCWIISNAGESNVNSTFTENGRSDGVKKFQATNGVELYRVCMPENVDLGLSKGNLIPGPDETQGEEPTDGSDDEAELPPASTSTPTRQKLSDRVKAKQLAKRERAKEEAAGSEPNASTLKITGPTLDPYDFNKLQRAGARMGLNMLEETAKRRRDQKVSLFLVCLLACVCSRFHDSLPLCVVRCTNRSFLYTFVIYVDTYNTRRKRRRK